MDSADSSGERQGDKWIASPSLTENQRGLVAAYAEVIENRNKAAKGHSVMATSMREATRTFAKVMRATLEESRRFAKEREQLLERERAARAEAEAARERLREVLESVGDAFFAVDREWRLTYVNHRAEQYWGRQREELLGRNIWEEFPQM